LTDEDSARGDAYETRVSDATTPTGSDANEDVSTNFTLSQTIVVAKGTFTRIALVADLAASGATPGSTNTHTISFSGVTATGATTGQDISETATGSGQAMTVSSGGTLTITQDASVPVVDILLGGETAILNVIRLAANNVEDLDVKDITVTATGGTDVDTFYFYNGEELLGTATGNAAPRIDLDNAQLIVPANGHVLVTIKAKMLMVDGSVVTNNTDIGASIVTNGVDTDAVNTVGVSSGSEVDSNTQDLAGPDHQLYESKPVFAVNASSESGDLIPQTQHELAIFDVTVEGEDNVTFQNSTTYGKLTVQINRTRNDTDGSADTWILKDGDGNTLDTTTVADAATSVTFDFNTKAFSVAPGQTKQLIVVGDTSEYEDNGDVIQVWLDDATATNIDWSIDSNSAAYAEADKIFRGDITAGSWVNPS